MSAINAISAGLAVVSFTFYLIGIIGYTPEKGSLVDVHWISINQGNSHIYFGLQNYYVDVSGSHNLVDYGSDECTQDFCDNCEWDGRVVGGLLIIALFFTVISFGLSAASVQAVSKPIGISNIVMSFIAFAVSLVGIIAFMGECYSDINGVYSPKAQWGPGAILSIIGMVLMGIVFLLQIAGAIKA
jgi:hypothetical protein